MQGPWQSIKEVERAAAVRVEDKLRSYSKQSERGESERGTFLARVAMLRRDQ